MMNTLIVHNRDQKASRRVLLNAMYARTALSIAGALALILPLLTYAQSAPTCTLVANPAVVTPGQGFTLSIISTGATSATVNNGIGTIEPNGSRQSISIAQTTTYTATVTGTGGSGTCSTTVIVDGTRGGFGTDGVGGAAGSGGSGGGGGGANPAQMLQGAGQMIGGLAGLMNMQNAMGGNNAANQMCANVEIDCPCGRDHGPKHNCELTVPRSVNNHRCGVGSCFSVVNGFYSRGQCTAPFKCEGMTSGGGSGALGGGQQGLGGGLQALGSILQGIGSIMGALNGGGGSGSGAGGGGQYPGGCSQYYYTATTTSDPCAIYQPGGNYGDYYTSDPTIPNISDSLLDYPITPTPSPVSGLLNTIGSGSAVSPGATLEERKDAGVIDNLRKGFSEVANYFGGDTLERLCQTRPWAGGGVIAGVAPDAFFDDLCRRAGYSQGFGGRGSTTFGSSDPVGQGLGTTTVTSQPTAEIRAEPASVRLGTRTYIFWTSAHVVSCSVRGPSFEQNSLFGAGATVPITGPTIFTISCTAADGSTVSDSVTVNLAI